MISLISKRILYLKEFVRGLSLYGIDDLLSKAPGLCKSFFVRGLIQDTIDANYLFFCMQPKYSDHGSSRRALEERVVDSMQDFLNNIVLYKLKHSVHKKVKVEIIVKPTLVELIIEMKQVAPHA